MKAHRSHAAFLAAALATSALSPATSQNVPQANAPLEPADARTSLDVTPGGTPVINIAAPNENGTSYNVFNTLSAGREGLIFNNSAVVGQSTIGGFILANPNLAKGQAAGLILSEVTGGLRTTLAGPIEVFGPRAALVIANPTGITCDGCGFINLSRVSLAAASLTFGADGKFGGFRTSGGDVAVEGKGLLGGNVDYFDIVAGAAHINASLYARDLVISGGSGTFGYGQRTSVAQEPGHTGIVIDSSALGGMYAGRIRLIGTGVGVGINLAGTLAATDGPLTISSDGAITIARTYAGGDAAITSASAAVTLSDQAYAAGNLSLAGQSLDQTGGFAGALGKVSLVAARDITLGQGAYAGLDTNGKVTGAGTLTVTAGGALSLANGTLAAGGALTGRFASLAQGSSSVIAGHGVSLASSGGQILAGTVTSAADALLSADVVDLAGTIEANDALGLSGRRITLAGSATGLGSAAATATQALAVSSTGTLQTNGALAITAPALSSAGRLTAGKGASLKAGALANTGTVLTGGALAVAVSGDAMLGGSISTNAGAVLVITGSTDLSGQLAAAKTLSLEAGRLTMSGSAQAGGDLTLKANGALAAGLDGTLIATGSAQVLANGPVTLTAAGSLRLAGQAGSNDALTLTAQSIDLSGTAQAQGKLVLAGAALEVSGKALTARDLLAGADRSALIEGTLSAGGNLTLTAPTLATTGTAQLLAGRAAALSAGPGSGPASVTHAGTLSGATVTVSSGMIANTGVITASGEMSLTALSSLAHSGTVQAGGNLTLTGPAITLSGQTIGATGGGAVTVSSPALAFAPSSNLQSGGALVVSSGADVTSRGKVVALGTLSLASGGLLTQGADVAAGGMLALSGRTQLDQAGSVRGASAVSLTGPVVTNSGKVSAGGTLDLAATVSLTSSGTLQSEGALSLTAPVLSLAGTIATNDVLTLTAPAVTLNGLASGLKGLAGPVRDLRIGAGGALQSGTALTLELATLDNAGLIFADGALTLATSGILASSGRIAAGGALTITAAQDLVSSGLLQAGSRLTLGIGGTGTLSGTAHSGKNARFTAGTLRLSGEVQALGALELASTADTDLSAASLTYATGPISFTAVNLTTGGTLQSDGSLDIRTARTLVLGGSIQASGGSTMSAGTTATVSARLAAGGALTLAASSVALPGQILANDTVTVSASSDNLSLTGTIQAAKDVALSARQRLTIGAAGAQGSGSASGTAAGGTGSGGSSGTGAGSPGSASSTSGGSASPSFTFSGPQLAAPLPGSLASSGAVTLTAADIEINGLVAAGGDLATLAAHVLKVNGSAWSDGALTARTGDFAVSAGASFAAHGPLTLTTTGSLTNLGTMASNAGDVSVTSGGAFGNSGTISAKGAYTVTASADYTASGTITADTLDIAARDVTLSGTTSGAQGITIAGRNLVLAAGSDTRSSAGLTLAATGPVTLAGKIGASGDLSIRSDAALGLLASSGIEVRAAARLSAGTLLTQASGSTLAAEGALTLSGSGLLLAGRVTGNAHMALAATDQLALSGTATALGSIGASAATTDVTGTLAASGGLTLSSGAAMLGTGSLLQAGGELSLSMATLDAGGRLQGDGGIKLTTSGDARISGTFVAGTVDGKGTVTRLADVSLNAQGALALAGSGSATARASLAGRTLTLSGGLVTLGDLDLAAGTLVASGQVEANGVLSAASSGNAVLGGALAGLAGLKVKSGGTLAQGASLASNGTVELEASGTLTTTGTVLGDGDIFLTGGSLSLGGTVTGNRSLTLASTAGPTQVARGAAFTAATLTLSSAGDATIAGTLLANTGLSTRVAGTLAITSTGELQAGTLDQDGAVTSTGTMTLGAAAAIANAGSIFSTGALQFNTPSLLNTGRITTGADFTLSAASLNLGGTFASLGNVTVTATAGSLAVTGGLEGRNVTLSATGGDLSLGASSHVTAFGGEAAGQASLTGTGAITALGVIRANSDIALMAGSTLRIGRDPEATGAGSVAAVSGLGNVTLTAGGAILNEGTLEAGKALTLEAASLASNTLKSADRLKVTAAGNISLTGTTYGGGVAISAKGGALAVAGTAAVQSLGDVTLDATGDLTNAGIVSAGKIGAALTGSVRLASGGVLTSSGGIVSNNSAVSLKGASIALGGSLASGGGVFAADTLTLDTPVLALLAGGEVAANGPLVYTGTSLSLGTGSLLQSNRTIDITLGSGPAPGSYVSAGRLIALGDLWLDVTGGALVNQAGSGIFAGGTGSGAPGGSISLAAASVDNAGQIVAAASAAGAGGNLSLSAPTVTTSGLIHADRTLALASSRLTIDGVQGSATNSLGAVEAGSAIDWTIPSLSLVQGGTLRSAGAVRLAGSSLGNDGTIEAGGNLAITTTGSLVSAGVLSSPGAISLASGTTLTLGRTSQTLAGARQAAATISQSSVTLAAPTVEALGSLGTTGALGVQANRLTVSGEVIANGDVTLGGYGPAPAQAPVLAITAGGQLASYLGNAELGTLARVDIAGTLLAARGNLAFTSAATTITAGGRVAAGQDLTLTTAAGGVITVSGEAAATRDLTLTGGTLMVTAGGLVRAGGDLAVSTTDAAPGPGLITINGTGYDYSAVPISARIAGTLRASRDLTLSVPGAMVVEGQGQIVAARDLAMTAGSALVGARTSSDASGTPAALGVIAGRDLRLSATSGAVTLDGSLLAGGSLAASASGDVTSTASAQLVAGRTLAVTGASLALAGLNSAQDSITLIARGDAVLAGASVSDGRISLSAAGAITITDTGSLTTRGGAGNTAFGRDIGDAANIALVSGSGLANRGTIWSDGVVFLKSAAGDVVNAASGTNGGITANTIVTRTDAGSFRNTAGAFKAANTGLFLGGDYSNTGSVTPSGNYWISAANITNSGLLATSGNLTLEAAGVISNTGTIYSGSRLALSAGGTLTNDYSGDDQGGGNHGLVLAQGDLAITARDLVNQSATIQSLAGNVTIDLTGGSLVNRIKSVNFVEVPGSGYIVEKGVASPLPTSFDAGLCGAFVQHQGTTYYKYTCFGSSLAPGDTVHRTTVINYAPGSGYDTTDEVDFTYGAQLNVDRHTGTGTIAAAGNLTISAGAGSVTNRNSALLAGGSIAIMTSGAVSNIADLQTSGTTNTAIPGAPTLIQAGGTVAIQAGSFTNTANNLVGPDRFTAGQVVQNTRPGTPANSGPGTGSAGIAAAGTLRQGMTVAGLAVIPGGSAAATRVTGGFAAQGAGGPASASGPAEPGLELAPARLSGAGNATGGGPVAPLAEKTALAGETNRAAPASVSGFAATGGGAAPTGLVAASAPGTGLTAGTPGAVPGASPVAGPGAPDGPAATPGAAPLAAGLVSAFNGAGLPGLSNQGFGTFLGSFLAGFNLAGNSPALFTYSSNQDSAYLFTTSAGLASQAALYDSSYFFGRLAPDRATTYTRLGDGFFEALLVSRQVQAATGTAQLGAFGSALEQYQGLLKSAADQQAGLGLSLGVALTGAQVAELTSPILWYVSAKVAGRDVLVPVLYLAAADAKAITASALVGGSNVLVSASGGITNSGTIRAGQIAALAANGGDLVNAAGGTIAGGAVIARAAQDIILKGASTISAEGSGSYALPGGTGSAGGQVTLSAGRDITTGTLTGRTVTFDQQRAAAGTWSNTTTTTGTITGAAIRSSGSTSLAAGETIRLDAAQLASGGATSLVAGQDVVIGGTDALTTTSHAEQTGRYTNAHGTGTATTFVGSTITSAGPVGIAALGGKVAITGGTVSTSDPTRGDISLYGGKGVEIAAAQETASSALFEQTGKRSTVTTSTTSTANSLARIDAAGALTVTTPGAVTIAGGVLEAGGALGVDAGSLAVTGVTDQTDTSVATYAKKKGFLSSTVTRTSTQTSDQSVVGSVLSGETVRIATIGSVEVKGSSVAASKGLAIDAGGPVAIGTLVETDTASQAMSVRKSGISLGGGGLFVGVAKTKTTEDTASTSNVGSLVGSETGKVTIVSGDRLGVTGSTVVAGGDVLLAGKSIEITNGLDVIDTARTARSSSVGFSFGVQSQAIQSGANLVDATKIATSTSNDRVSAVAGLASGVAAVNTVNAVKDLSSTVSKGTGDLGITVGVSFGISKSSSSDRSHDETVVASKVSGTNVTLLATGTGEQGSIGISGSQVSAANNLTLAATGPITIAAAQETDTQSGSAKSSGLTVGATWSLGLDKKQGLTTSGPTISAGVSSSKSSYSGSDVTNIESTLSAGNVASVTTPGALTIDGSVLSGDKVVVDAGSLAIASRQDTSTYSAASKSGSLGVSVAPGGGVSVNGNFSTGKQTGDFASVAEQAGIDAGSQGYDIKVAGNTDLKGAVIVSEAEPAKNSLTTGTLTASDIQNREQYAASQTSLGAGLSFGGGTTGIDRKNQASSTGATPAPGVKVPGLGTLSATPPIALSAGGSQSGTTTSAIASGSITITSGDAASQNLAVSISRDTANANAGALTQAFTEAKRTEIAQGFQAAQILSSETNALLSAQAAKADQWTRDNPNADPKTNPYATWGAGGTGRLILTALNGAAGSNVTGSLGSLVQGAAVNVLQGLATSEVKKIVDSLEPKELVRDADGQLIEVTHPTAGGEAVRSALQALTACAGQAAGGSGDCGSAAMGAAASVVLNNLLSTGKNSALGPDGKPLPQAEQQARDNLVSTLVGAIAQTAGLDPGSAIASAQIETQNNSVRHADGQTQQVPFVYAQYSIEELIARNPESELSKLVQQIASQSYGGDTEKAITEYTSYVKIGAETCNGCVVDENVAFSRLARAYSSELESTKVQDYAYLAGCSYGSSCELAGFTVVNPRVLGIDPSLLHQANGLDAVIYKRGDQFVLAFAGTKATDPMDLGNDALQASGISSSPQYDSAVVLAKLVSRAVGEGNLTLVGHSLGGGQAAVGAAVTGRPAVTFNAAPISVSTLSRYGVFSTDKGRIDNFVVYGDPVTASQSITPTGSLGNQHLLTDPSPNNPLDNHGISTVIKALGPLETRKPSNSTPESNWSIPYCGTPGAIICKPKIPNGTETGGY